MNENSPLISIIVPVYNAEAFIEKAFDFIKIQTVKIPYEVIFVDNNSKDNSFSILEGLAIQYSYIRIFKEVKQGAAAARNTGLSKARGDYIYFYDVDDQLFEDTLASLYNALVSYPEAKAAFGNMLKISLSELKDHELLKNNPYYEEVFYKPPFWGLTWHKDLKTVVGPPAFLYRKQVFEKIGNYEEFLLTGEDTALDIKLGMTFPVVHLNKNVYAYIKHSSSTMQETKKKISVEQMQWPRLTKSHLPFYIDHQKRLPIEFYQVLEKRIFSYIGKLILQTKGINNRLKLKLKLEKDIVPVKLPLIINLYLILLAFIPAKIVLKFYLYYLLPNYSSNIYKN